MRLSVLLLLAFVAVASAGIFGPLKKIECDICYDIVDDTESWIGKEEQKDENKIISRCLKFFRFFHADEVAKRFCQGLLEKGLDDTIHRMEDPNQEKKDAASVCEDLHACPRK